MTATDADVGGTPDPADVAHVLPLELSDRLRRVLDPASPAEAITLLTEYFTPPPAGRFSGGRFEQLAGGGDRPEVANTLTADDLVALATLAVPVRGNVALEILEVRAEHLSELLSNIPVDDRFVRVDASAFAPGSAVRALYDELRSIHDVGVTSATKLMARKRPHLIPIADSVVMSELSIVNEQLWQPLHAWMLAAGPDGQPNHEHLDKLRDKANLPKTIATLRVFDVIAWRVGSGHAGN